MGNRFKISTEYTFFFKVIMPGIFLIAILIGFVILFQSEDYAAFGSLLLISIAGSTLVYFGFVRIKSVSIDKNHFYISNYLKTIQVPISDLLEVNDKSFPGSYKPITLHFKTRNYFGYSIVFLPEFESPNASSKIPLAEKLRRLI